MRIHSRLAVVELAVVIAMMTPVSAFAVADDRRHDITTAPEFD